MFRLALINPNTDELHTQAMQGVAAAALPAESTVTAANPDRGPSAIESEADAVVAAAEVLDLVRSLPPHDAYLIACFGDPALDAVREIAEAPVIGIGEAAFAAASLVAKRFGIITTLPRSIPALEEALDRQGLRSRCAGIVALGIPVAEQGSHHPDTTPAVIAAARQLVADQRAEALILACGGMADVARAVEEGAGVPVCDGVAFGAMLAYSLWRCGLRTSRVGAYAAPEPIPYAEAPGR